MEIKMAQSKTGKPIPVFFMQEREAFAMMDEHGGFCAGCGVETYGIEPDARKYHCESCGQNRVYGIEELVLMNRVRVKS